MADVYGCLWSASTGADEQGYSVAMSTSTAPGAGNRGGTCCNARCFKRVHKNCNGPGQALDHHVQHPVCRVGYALCSHIRIARHGAETASQAASRSPGSSTSIGQHHVASGSLVSFDYFNGAVVMEENGFH